MRIQLITLLLFLGTGFLFAQNEKVDSLMTIIEMHKEEIELLKEEVAKEVKTNGYTTLATMPSYKKGDILLKDSRDSGADVIDTIPRDSEIIILDRSPSSYKISYNGKIGYVSSFDLDIDIGAIDYFYRFYYIRGGGESKGSSRTSSGRTFVKGHYRTTSSGKRVYVKGHWRNN